MNVHLLYHRWFCNVPFYDLCIIHPHSLAGLFSLFNISAAQPLYLSFIYRSAPEILSAIWANQHSAQRISVLVLLSTVSSNIPLLLPAFPFRLYLVPFLLIHDSRVVICDVVTLHFPMV